MSVYRDSQGRFSDGAEAQRREMEINFLDSATTMREYIDRRNAQRFLVADPDQPLDQMSASDYIKMRERQERDDRWRPQMGTSYREYLGKREDEGSFRP